MLINLLKEKFSVLESVQSDQVDGEFALIEKSSDGLKFVLSTQTENLESLLGSVPEALTSLLSGVSQCLVQIQSNVKIYIKAADISNNILEQYPLTENSETFLGATFILDSGEIVEYKHSYYNRALGEYHVYTFDSQKNLLWQNVEYITYNISESMLSDFESSLSDIDTTLYECNLFKRSIGGKELLSIQRRKQLSSSLPEVIKGSAVSIS